MEYDEYIGDGVYVSFDGYQIWLAVNDHQNKVVALEPAVMFNLMRYFQFTEDLKKKPSLENANV